jgi:hypothetical protein
LLAALRVKLQALVPVQAPLHPANVSFVAGVSLKVTALFGAKLAVHPVVDPAVQLMPAGELVTVPAPAPASATVTAVPPLNAAVMLALDESVIAHVLVPVQDPPLHPVKNCPDPGVAVSVTAVFGAKLAEHVVGQLIPAGLLVTVPVPVSVTVRPSSALTTALNVAETAVAAVSVSAQVDVPEHAPPHPPKE